MPKNNEFTNNSMNSSSALVAPMRSEIRFPFISVAFPALGPSTRKLLHRAAMILTPVLCAVLAVCCLLGVFLPSWLVFVMVTGASVGFVYGFIHIVTEAELFEQTHGEGGRR